MRALLDFFDRNPVYWCPQGVVYYRVIIHVDWSSRKKRNIDINNNKLAWVETIYVCQCQTTYSPVIWVNARFLAKFIMKSINMYVIGNYSDSGCLSDLGTCKPLLTAQQGNMEMKQEKKEGNDTSSRWKKKSWMYFCADYFSSYDSSWVRKRMCSKIAKVCYEKRSENFSCW